MSCSVVNKNYYKKHSFAQNAENCISELLDFKILAHALGNGEAAGLNLGLVCVCQWLLKLSL